MKKTISIVLTLTLSLLGTQALAKQTVVYHGGARATPEAMQYDATQTYVVVYGKNFAPAPSTAPAFLKGVFCPVVRKSMTGCKGSGGLVIGDRRTSFNASVKPDRFFVVQKIPSQIKGRYGFANGSAGSKSVRVLDATYYFDTRPGDVIVLGPAGVSPKQAISEARQFLTENFGAKFNTVPYRSMSAAKISCSGKNLTSKQTTCQFGADLDPRNISRN